MQHLLVVVFSLLFMTGSDALPGRTPPLMCGTLWWLSDSAETPWTREKLEEAVAAQQAVGFDLLWILNMPALFAPATAENGSTPPRDLPGMLYEIADAHGMRVIADLPKGGWYGKTKAADMAAEMTAFAKAYHARYGAHPSFHGWYLNHEINPIAPEDTEQTAFWRAVWRETAAACHAIAPGSIVTISPFFLLDRDRKRGFVYQTPEEYGAWWEATLRETGIDVLMLQDSGEHLSFFTIEDREPFWRATAEACHKAGAAFWLNVESGEAVTNGWDHFVAKETQGGVPWRFTPMPWLAQKLEAAARYADAIVNWGYFPYMNPHPWSGAEIPGQREAYEAYKAYYESRRAPRPGA